MSAINPSPAADPSGDKRSYEPSMEEILASIRRIIADDQSIPARGGRIGDPISTVESSHELLRMPPVQRSAAPVPSEPAPQPMAPAGPEPTEAAPAHPAPASPMAADDAAAPTPHGIAAHGSIAAPQYPAPDGGGAGAAHPGREPSAAMASEPAVLEVAADPADEPHAEGAPHAAATPTLAPLEEEDEIFDEPIAPKPADGSPLFSASTDAAVSSAFNMLAASRLADNSEELMNIAKEMIRPMLRAWLDDNLPSMVERMVRAEIERVARGGR